MINVKLPHNNKINRYKVMTVQIDQSNSNPATCCSYFEDASNMVKGSADWDEFFGHRPCLFKDGKVVGYLNPNDFSKFEDGTPADITSGNAGDVMIEFPRRGLLITNSGNTITIRMTDDPDNADFKYYAHQRGLTNKDYFYVGCYHASLVSNKLRSLSGKTMVLDKKLGDWISYAHNLGNGYEEYAFYQHTYLQAMYTLKYAHLNSWETIGYGIVGGSRENSGGSNAKGMDFGSTNNSEQVKLFGIEDFWGNVFKYLAGVYIDPSYYMFTTTDNFNDTGSGYVNQGKACDANTGVKLKYIQGSTTTGFIPKDCSASDTTYFCSWALIHKSPNDTRTIAKIGGCYADKIRGGINSFTMVFDQPMSASSSWMTTGRLMYL